jgi:hypothetical protein
MAGVEYSHTTSLPSVKAVVKKTQWVNALTLDSPKPEI